MKRYLTRANILTAVFVGVIFALAALSFAWWPLLKPH